MKQCPELRSEDGQTAAEYGVILAVITPAIIAALALLSDTMADKFTEVAGFLS